MSLLDDLLAVGRKLEVKIEHADISDILVGVIHVLDRAGIDVSAAVAAAHPTQAPGQVPATALAEAAPVQSETDEPETIGSLVVDAAPAGPPAFVVGDQAPDEPPPPAEAEPVDPLAGYTVEQLTDELARRQQAAIEKADAEKSTITSEPEGHA